MDVLKTAIDWTKAEILSSSIFVLFGVVFLLVSLGHWHLGKTDMARAYVVPAAVAGALLLIIGVGIFVQSYGRISGFAQAYDADVATFLAAEMQRAERVLGQYTLALYRVIPVIVVASAILFVLLDSPQWRAACVTAIALMSVILVLDSNANARLQVYQSALEKATRAEGPD